jgi:hypothetical protein
MVGIYITHFDDGNPIRRGDFMRQQMELQRQGIEFDIVQDIVGRGCWPTARAAWVKGISAGADHILVLSDDMLPSCENFLAAVEGMAGAVGDSAIMSIFSMRKMTRTAVQLGSSWCSTPDGVWGGSIMMSRNLAQEFIVWEAMKIKPDFNKNHDDRRVAFYAMTKNIPIFVASRQIVQHLGAAHSSVGYSNSGRVASNLFTGDGATIDWTAGLPDPPRYTGTVPKSAMLEALR